MNTITLDAGLNQTVAFPCSDITLFGHAQSSDPNAALTYAWTCSVSGLIFSNANALITSVRILTPGVYTFTLKVNDGTQTVATSCIVTILAANTTAFYVDPLFSGTSDGSATAPWTVLLDYAGSVQWAAINAALAKGPVIVYYTANGVATKSINIWRTDPSSNRLTFDGMSLVNSSPSKPYWSLNTTSSKFGINVTNTFISIGVQSSNPSYPMHYTTLRGFSVSGGSARVTGVGNFLTIEYIDVHDITGTGANIMILPPVTNYPDCKPSFGNCKGMTIRSCTVIRGWGEGIYISGTYLKIADGGCQAWGPTHSDILIENNIINQINSNGGQPDCIDCKAGLSNVTIRGNDLSGAIAGTCGIVSLGVIPNADGTHNQRTNFLIENNRIHDRLLGSSGIYLINHHYSIIKNNAIYNSAGISLSQGSGSAWPYTFCDFIQILNNSLNSSGLAIQCTDAIAKLRYNLITGYDGSQQFTKASTAPPTNIDSDYNVMIQSVHSMWSSGWPEGTHTLLLTNPAVTPV